MGDIRVAIRASRRGVGFMPVCTTHGDLLRHRTMHGDLVTAAIEHHSDLHPDCA